MHSDDRVRLRATCYFDDCPPGCGGFTVWPRSHTRVWVEHRAAMRDRRAFSDYHNPPERTNAALAEVQPWAVKSLSADLTLNVLKDTYDYSCFSARLY